MSRDVRALLPCAPYAVAAGAVVCALGLAWAAMPAAQGALLAPFFAAVAVSAWHGGLRPGLLAIGLSVLAIKVVQNPRAGPLHFELAADAASLVAFAVVALLIVSLRSGRERSEAARQQLLHREREVRAAAEEALEVQRRIEHRLQLVVDASGTLLQSLEMGRVLPKIVDLSRELIAADACAVWRRHAASGQWRVEAAFGLSEEYQRRAVEAMPHDGSLTGMLDRPTPVEDIAAVPGLAFRRGLYDAEGIRALLVVPLRIQGEASGTITFYYRRPRPFAEEELRSATALANLSSAAIGIAELYQDQIRLRSEAEASERTAAFLAEATVVLTASLDYETTLTTLADLAVPTVADWCAIDMEDHGRLRRLATAHADRARSELARQLHERYPPDPAAPFGPPHVFRTGRSEIQPRIEPEQLALAAQDPGHLQMLRELGLRSYMCVPLRARGRPLGAITFITSESGREFGPSDLALAEDLARRASVAVENARLHAEAHDANRLKDEFLATLSHELRTPLNAVLGWARMLDLGALDAAGVRRALDAIRRNARLQAQLIDDLLDVSRIITGKFRLDMREIDLGDVAEAAVDSIRPTAEARGVALHAVVDARAGRMVGDADRLQQAVWNLLANAVKFTDPGGRVEVRLTGSGSSVELAVADTGCGIRPELLPVVFDRFRQGDSSATRRHGGLGLGLAIVRHVVELHGGSVTAESAGEGMGATFTVRLPPVPALMLHDAGGLVRESGVESRSVRQLAPLAGLRLLIVDHRRDSRELLVGILAACGATLREAASAAEAVDAIRTWMPDVLIADVDLPGENGLELIRRVRALEHERGGRLPAVALTSHAAVDERIRALSAGYQLHLARPVEPAELAAAVASLAPGRAPT